MLRAFGENGEWSKTLNIWACDLYLLVTEWSKKSLKMDYENLVHVYLLTHFTLPRLRDISGNDEMLTWLSTQSTFLEAHLNLAGEAY